MLLYLDNFRSVGPDSMLAGRAQERTGKTLGINENLAREIMELHTLGVNGGYTPGGRHGLRQGDHGLVDRRGGQGALPAAARPGSFSSAPISTSRARRPSWAPLPAAGPGARASRCCWTWRDTPRRAQHIATQLARHFIADDPPPDAVSPLARVFSRTGGDLPAVYRALIAEDAAWSQPLQQIQDAERLCDFNVARARHAHR